MEILKISKDFFLFIFLTVSKFVKDVNHLLINIQYAGYY